jgi:hypothetical protein
MDRSVGVLLLLLLYLGGYIFFYDALACPHYPTLTFDLTNTTVRGGSLELEQALCAALELSRIATVRADGTCPLECVDSYLVGAAHICWYITLTVWTLYLSVTVYELVGTAACTRSPELLFHLVYYGVRLLLLLNYVIVIVLIHSRSQPGTILQLISMYVTLVYLMTDCVVRLRKMSSHSPVSQTNSDQRMEAPLRV